MGKQVDLNDHFRENTWDLNGVQHHLTVRKKSSATVIQ